MSKQSTYRFYPSAESQAHFTAILLDDRLLQVKPYRKTFKEIQDWVNFALSEAGITNILNVKLTAQDEENQEEEDIYDVLEEMELRSLLIFPAENDGVKRLEEAYQSLFEETNRRIEEMKSLKTGKRDQTAHLNNVGFMATLRYASELAYDISADLDIAYRSLRDSLDTPPSK